MRSTGYHSGPKSSSCVSHVLHSADHVASRHYSAELWLCARFFRIGTVCIRKLSVLSRESRMISGNRMEKHSLTRQPESVAVRHRLLQSSLASSYEPFVVELFIADRLNRSPGESDPVSTVTSRKLPTPAVLNEPARIANRSRAPRTGLRLINSQASPALRHDDPGTENQSQGMSASPPIGSRCIGDKQH